jgi:hypothetical protein
MRIQEDGGDIIITPDSPEPITKHEVMQRREFHYTGRGPCHRIFGPRGKTSDQVVRARESGRTQTWKTRPTEFRQPVKHGLSESSAITHTNAAHFHSSFDCPLGRPGFPRTREEAEALLTLRHEARPFGYSIVGFDQAGQLVLKHDAKNEGLEFESVALARAHFTQAQVQVPDLEEAERIKRTQEAQER